LAQFSATMSSFTRIPAVTELLISAVYGQLLDNMYEYQSV